MKRALAEALCDLERPVDELLKQRFDRLINQAGQGTTLWRLDWVDYLETALHGAFPGRAIYRSGAQRWGGFRLPHLSACRPAKRRGFRPSAVCQSSDRSARRRLAGILPMVVRPLNIPLHHRQGGGQLGGGGDSLEAEARQALRIFCPEPGPMCWRWRTTPTIRRKPSCCNCGRPARPGRHAGDARADRAHSSYGGRC